MFLLSWLVICLRICILQIAWCYWCFPTFIYYNWPSNFWQFSQLSSIYKWNLLLFWRGFSLQMIWLSSPLTTIYWTCPWGFLRKPSGFSNREMMIILNRFKIVSWYYHNFWSICFCGPLFQFDLFRTDSIAACLWRVTVKMYW